MERSEGFPPVADERATLLILGSLPSDRSIARQQYYAHPQNAFWRIMGEVFGAEGDYRHRCDTLIRNRVALWDVLHSSVRPGSMDADIRLETARGNDFGAFFATHPQITQVLCNGQKAGQLFGRLVAPELDVAPAIEIMPSTSPAYAAMRYDVKLERWRSALLKDRSPA